MNSCLCLVRSSYAVSVHAYMIVWRQTAPIRESVVITTNEAKRCAEEACFVRM